MESRKDSIVLLSPLAFLLSIFQILSWGFEPFSGLAFFLSILVLFSNFHALYRYFERLYVDHYTPLMYIWAISTTIVSIASLVLLIYFLPSTPLTLGKALKSFKPVEITTERLNGSFRTGFENARTFQKTNLTIYQLQANQAENENSGRPVFVFFPDKRGESYNYFPYLFRIAQSGYTVISTDFNSNDCRWLHNVFDSRVFRRLGMIFASLTNPYKFDSQKEFYTYNSSLECEAIFKILQEKFSPGTKFVLASDFMADTAISDFQKSHQNEIAGLFYMEELSESGDYKTPGYGFVAYTDPLLATILKVDRDKTGFSPDICAKKTREILDQISARLADEQTGGATASAELL